MRQVTRKGLITIAAAGGVFALGSGYAQADSGATGDASNSPGVLSGNSIQAPVHIPVNACGNTVNVVGLLNPAMGSECTNGSDSGSDGQSGGSQAGGEASNSPGVGSGNVVQAPVHVPVNTCGNGVTVIGLLNPAGGAGCDTGSADTTPPAEPGEPAEPSEPSNPGSPEEPAAPVEPGTPEEPATPEEPGTPGVPLTPEVPATPYEPNNPGAQTITQPVGSDELAQTGVGPLGMLIPAGAGLLLGGAVLYRRARASA
jgi:hypothetical protein